MLKTIDTQQEEDPNIVGEIFREYTFVGEGLGCYSNFDVKDSFMEQDHAFLDMEVHRRIGGLILDESEEALIEYLVRVTIYQDSDTGLIVAWHWDGDGTLYFREGDVEVINTDCKNAYTWEFLNA